MKVTTCYDRDYNFALSEKYGLVKKGNYVSDLLRFLPVYDL